MPEIPPLRWRLKGVDEFSKTFGKAEGAMGKLGGVFGKLKSGLAGVAQTALGVSFSGLINQTVGFVKEGISMAGQLETLTRSFDAFSVKLGATNLSLAGLRKATQGTVSDIDLLTSANQAMALGLPTEDLDDLFEAAMKVGHAMGRTTKQAVQDLTTGIGRQSKLILDNLGILVNTDKAYEDYALSIGKVKTVTEEEATAEAALAKLRLAEIKNTKTQLRFTQREIGLKLKNTALTKKDRQELQKQNRALTAQILALDREENALREVAEQTRTLVGERVADVAALTAEERKTAFMTAAIAALNDKAETLEGTMSKAQTTQEQFTATVDNLQAKLGNALMPVMTEVMEAFSGFIGHVESAITAIRGGDWEGAFQVIEDTFGDIGGKFVSWFDAINWGEVWTGLKTFAGTLWTKIKQWAGDIGLAFLNWFGSIDWVAVFTELETWFNDFWSWAFSEAGDPEGAFKKWIDAVNWDQVFDSLAQFALHLPYWIWTKITESTWNLGNLLRDWIMGQITGAIGSILPGGGGTVPGASSPGSVGGAGLTQVQAPSNITATIIVQGDLTEDAYERIRPQLQEDLKNVVIESTSTGAQSDHILFRRFNPGMPP